MKSFLEKYNTVIFDMDGVITSEENYWNSAALTVREFLSADEKPDPAQMSRNVHEIRCEIFAGDRIISELKRRGVNSNWDLGYITVLIALILGTDDSGRILGFAEGLSDNILEEFDRLANEAAKKTGKPKKYYDRNGELWTAMHDCFQEWFLGDELFIRQYGKKPVLCGKPGLVHDEMPIIPMDALKKLLTELSGTKRVCTGTGRPYIEMRKPLEAWGVIDCFAADGLCNYDHVAAAEANTGMTLTKPHPYMFLKALYGTGYDDKRIIDEDYDADRIKTTLVVGDAGADILAARAMGADFCAVLTGIGGKAAKAYFERLGAEYILDSAAELL